jgi:hypothetical protein
MNATVTDKNGQWFDAGMDKLDRWAEDQRKSLKVALEDLDLKIQEAKKEARSAPNLPVKLELQRQLRQLESKRNDAWKEFDDSSREVERKKDSLLDEISQRHGRPGTAALKSQFAPLHQAEKQICLGNSRLRPRRQAPDHCVSFTCPALSVLPLCM